MKQSNFRPGLILALIVFALIPAYRSYEQSTKPPALPLPSNGQLTQPSPGNQPTLQQLLSQPNQ